MRIDRLSVLSRSLQWWCMAAFGRWSDLFGWFRQRTRSKLPSRNQDCPKDSNLLSCFGSQEFHPVGFFSAGFLVLHKVRFWATAGLWCSSMFWATRALQCQWEQDSRNKESCLIQKSGEPPESHRPDWDRGLQLLVAQRGMSRRRSSSNCADYVPAICTHRPSLFPMDGEIQVVGLAPCREDNRYLIIRGSKSRNKVAVGEPAAGSFFRCLQKYLKNKKPEGASAPFSH